MLIVYLSATRAGDAVFIPAFKAFYSDHKAKGVKQKEGKAA